MTTAVSTLEERLSQQIGDWLEVICTTAIAANNFIISTHLTSYDSGRNDYFNDWWVYITNKKNITVLRQVSDYATGTGTLTVRGAALTAEDLGTDYATIRLHRYNRDLYIRAFNDTIREIFPELHRRLDVTELVNGNILPNSHFRDWAVSTAPDNYAMIDANITAIAYTTAGGYRGGAKSMKASTGVGGAGKYVYISSKSYPRLLDLMGKTVSFYCWAQPLVTADIAAIEIWTTKADGTTTQTLTSTTTNPINYFTLLKLEDQEINDDITEIQFRFKITTASKDVYFDHARVIGLNQKEYLLPTDFKNGKLARVEIQQSGYSDEIVDDLQVTDWEKAYGWSIVDDGTNKFLQLPLYYSSPRLIRLFGYAPLTTVSAYTDPIEIEGETLNLFIAYAKYKLWQMIEPPVSSQDIGRYESQSAKAYGEYLRLRPLLAMRTPKGTMNIKGVY